MSSFVCYQCFIQRSLYLQLSKTTEYLILKVNCLLRAIRISTAMRFFNDCACVEDKMSNISGLFLVKPKIKKNQKKKTFNSIEIEYYREGHRFTSFSKYCNKFKLTFSFMQSTVANSHNTYSRPRIAVTIATNIAPYSNHS